MEYFIVYNGPHKRTLHPKYGIFVRGEKRKFSKEVCEELNKEGVFDFVLEGKKSKPKRKTVKKNKQFYKSEVKNGG